MNNLMLNMRRYATIVLLLLLSSVINRAWADTFTYKDKDLFGGLGATTYGSGQWWAEKYMSSKDGATRQGYLWYLEGEDPYDIYIRNVDGDLVVGNDKNSTDNLYRIGKRKYCDYEFYLNYDEGTDKPALWS